MISSAVVLCCVFVVASCADPVVECPAPRSPDGGQAFLYHSGRVVKFVCEPGTALIGQKTSRCVDGQWENPSPLCAVEEEGALPEPRPEVTPPLQKLQQRPLFKWGEEAEVENATASGLQADQPAVMLVPGRRARVRSAAALDAERRRRGDGATVISLQAPVPPPAVYVRNLGKSRDQERTLRHQYRTAALHGPEQVRIYQIPRAAASQNDKGEETLRHMYWMAAANYHQRQPSLVEWAGSSSHPVELTESQIAWIHSLPAELRDRYLRDLYVLRAEEAAEGARAHAFLRRYDDAYNLYTVRQTVPVDPETLYDYSCNQAGSPFVRAPRMQDAHVSRYDRRQNPRHPRNHYLTAIYRCNPGFRMLDDRFVELHCSKRQWVGREPVCVQNV